MMRLLSCVGLLLVCSVPAGAETFHEAVTKQDTARVKALLKERPALVNEGNAGGETGLHLAAYVGSSELVSLLLARGASVDAPEATATTPLHYAAYAGQEKTVALLLANHANINATNIERSTALHFAARRGKTATARLLLDKGGAINAENCYGYTPLDLAVNAEHAEVAELLASRGGRKTEIQSPEVKRIGKQFARVLFPFGDRSQIGVCYGKDGWLMIDSGFTHRTNAELKRTLVSLGPGPLRYLINTHLHPDHIAGNEVADEKTVVINYENLDQLAAKGVLTRINEPLAGNGAFGRRYELTFNGEVIRLIPAAGIHTDTDLLVHVTGSGVVAMGDLLLSQSFPSITKKADEYLTFLDTVIDVFPASTTFVSGHGHESTRTDVIRYRDMLAATADLVRRQLAQGKSKSKIIAADVLRDYHQWGVFIPILNQDYWITAVCNTYARDPH